MKLTFVVACILAAIFGCAPPPAALVGLPPDASAIDAIYVATGDEVRAAVMSALDVRGIAVERADGDRGVIVARFATADAGEDELACTGLSAEGGLVSAIRYRLWFHLVPGDGRTTVVRAYADVQGRVSTGAPGGAWTDCQSTGEIERRVLDEIQSHLVRR